MACPRAAADVLNAHSSASLVVAECAAAAVVAVTPVLHHLPSARLHLALMALLTAVRGGHEDHQALNMAHIMDRHTITTAPALARLVVAARGVDLVASTWPTSWTTWAVVSALTLLVLPRALVSNASPRHGETMTLTLSLAPTFLILLHNTSFISLFQVRRRKTSVLTGMARTASFASPVWCTDQVPTKSC